MSPRQPLVSREAIAAEALQLMDEEGLEAVSMRALAARLGVTAMALYRYYPRKELLLDAVVDMVLQEMDPPQESGGWEQRVVAMAGAYRRTMLAHPNVLPLFSSRPTSSPEALRRYEQGLVILRQTGFDDLTVVRCYFAVFNYTLGFVTTEINRLMAIRTAPKNSDAPDPFGAVPADQFPLVAALNPLVPMLGDDQFLFGLRLLIAGLRRL